MNVSQVALGFRAVRRLRPRAGERAVVVGVGPLGAAVRAVLTDVGVHAGVTEAVPGSETLDGVTLLIDTTGDPAVIAALLETAPPLSRVGLLASNGGGLADVDFYRTVHQRGLDVVGVSDATPPAPEDVRAAEDLARRTETSPASAPR
jgi:threonine dehydrogenase-like Zn-dependent dehydrogenase